MIKIKCIEDIQNLIENEIEESLTLDYKKELGNRNDEISKDVSAFANTYGGMLIYGVDEENTKPKFPICWIIKKGTKERIENIILSRIQPKIESFYIKSFDNPKNDKEAVFVVEILESLNGPHMNNDNKYYIRRNFKSEPMSDEEVKNAIFRKGFKEALIEEIEFNRDNGKAIGSNFETVSRLFDQAEKSDRTLRKTNRQIVFTPFRTETWQLVKVSGLFGLLTQRYNDLIKLYNKIHEANHLIELQKHNHHIIHNEKSDSGTYLPNLVRDCAQFIHAHSDIILKKIKE